MSAESRTLARESPIRSMYFEARITRISYTLGRSCDPLENNIVDLANSVVFATVKTVLNNYFLKYLSLRNALHDWKN